MNCYNINSCVTNLSTFITHFVKKYFLCVVTNTYRKGFFYLTVWSPRTLYQYVSLNAVKFSSPLLNHVINRSCTWWKLADKMDDNYFLDINAVFKHFSLIQRHFCIRLEETGVLAVNRAAFLGTSPPDLQVHQTEQLNSIALITRRRYIGSGQWL